LRFDNINEAIEAKEHLAVTALNMEDGLPAYQVKYDDVDSYHGLVHSESPVWSHLEANIIMSFAIDHPKTLPVAGRQIVSGIQARILKDIQSRIGSVWKIEHLSTNPATNEYMFRVEMDAVSAADAVIRTYGVGIDLVHIIKIRSNSQLTIVSRVCSMFLALT
jgi:hypothetical protein